MYSRKRKIVKWIQIAIIIYCGIGLAVYYLQDNILFHPKKLESNHVFAFKTKFEEINIPINETDTINLVKFFPTATPKNAVVIYFHGNRENIERYEPFVSVFLEKGYEVWMPDYPGFGKSRGQITEEKLLAQALQIQKMAAGKFSSDSIIIYGKSLGSGIAAYVASLTKNQQLILETPYASIPDIFRSYLYIYPLDRMIQYKIPTTEYLEYTKISVTIFTGSDDWVIPRRCSNKLKTFLKPTDQFIELDNANHQTVNKHPKYLQIMDKILN